MNQKRCRYRNYYVTVCVHLSVVCKMETGMRVEALFSVYTTPNIVKMDSVSPSKYGEGGGGAGAWYELVEH